MCNVYFFLLYILRFRIIKEEIKQRNIFAFKLKFVNWILRKFTRYYYYYYTIRIEIPKIPIS